MTAPLEPGRELHRAALAIIESLAPSDPSPDTPIGRALMALAAAVEDYERASLAPPFGDAGEPADEKTGWPAPDLMQDDDRGLSKALAAPLEARLLAKPASITASVQATGEAQRLRELLRRAQTFVCSNRELAGANDLCSEIAEAMAATKHLRTPGVAAVERVGPGGWNRLAESLRALGETDERIEELRRRYGLDADGVETPREGQHG